MSLIHTERGCVCTQKNDNDLIYYTVQNKLRVLSKQDAGEIVPANVTQLLCEFASYPVGLM